LEYPNNLDFFEVSLELFTIICATTP